MTLNISIDGISGSRSVIVFHYLVVFIYKLGVVLSSLHLPCLPPSYKLSFYQFMLGC